MVSKIFTRSCLSIVAATISFAHTPVYAATATDERELLAAATPGVVGQETPAAASFVFPLETQELSHMNSETDLENARRNVEQILTDMRFNPKDHADLKAAGVDALIDGEIKQMHDEVLGKDGKKVDGPLPATKKPATKHKKGGAQTREAMVTKTLDSKAISLALKGGFDINTPGVDSAIRDYVQKLKEDGIALGDTTWGTPKENDDIKAARTYVIDYLTELSNRVFALSQHKEALKAACEKFERLSAQDDPANQLRDEVAQLEERLTEKQKIQAKLERELVAAHQGIEPSKPFMRVREKVEETKGALTEKQRSVETQEIALREQGQALQKAREDATGQQKDEKQLEERQVLYEVLRSLQHQETLLASIQETATKQLGDKAGEIGRLKEDLETATKRLGDKAGKIGRLKEDLETATKQLAAKAGEITELQGQHQRLKEAFNRTSQQLRAMRSNSLTYLREKEQAERDLAISRTRIAALENALKELGSRYSTDKDVQDKLISLSLVDVIPDDDDTFVRPGVFPVVRDDGVTSFVQSDIQAKAPGFSFFQSIGDDYDDDDYEEEESANSEDKTTTEEQNS